MRELVERLARKRRPRKPREGGGFGQVDKEMNAEVYKLRRVAMDYIYRAKNLVKKELGVDIPRVRIRITELTDKKSRALASARMGKPEIWVTEQATGKSPGYVHEIVFHELVHALFNVGHDPSCPLMNPVIAKKPLSPAKLDKIFLEYAKRMYGGEYPSK